MKVALLCIIICSYLNIWETQGVSAGSIQAFGAISDYYWRDFKGLVPTDAIPGGVDESGAITYIGQFTTVAEYNFKIANIHILPATITSGSKIAVAAYHGRTVYSNSTSNLKVLCSNNVRRYKWMSKTSQFPPNCRFVVGGLEDNIPMYIGRATQGKEKLIGKIYSVTTVHRPDLISPYRGGEIIHEKFEVLTICY